MVPYMISYILYYALEWTPELTLFSNISSGIQFMAHGSTLFIYFTFNKLFRSVLLEYIKKRCIIHYY